MSLFTLLLTLEFCASSKSDTVDRTLSNLLLGDSGGVVNSLDFCPASLKSLGCFYFRCLLSSQWKAVTVNLRILHCQLYRHFWRPVVIMCLAISNNMLLVLQDAPKRIFLRTHDLLVSQKTTQKHFFSTLHPLSAVHFATATVFAFVLLRDLRFNFHCYTQHEATPTPKSARKCAATSRDFLRERLQSAFTLANQPR